MNTMMITSFDHSGVPIRGIEFLTVQLVDLRQNYQHLWNSYYRNLFLAPNGHPSGRLPRSYAVEFSRSKDYCHSCRPQHCRNRRCILNHSQNFENLEIFNA